MSAKFRSFESLLKPDPKFKDKMMGKFINCLMEGGKKSTAQKIFYTALEEVHKKIADKDLQAIFTQAITNVMPVATITIVATWVRLMLSVCAARKLGVNSVL